MPKANTDSEKVGAARPVLIVPNWNGANELAGCLDSLIAQSLPSHIIVVDNGSVDNSLEIIGHYKQVELVKHNKNKGYAGGVNPGFRRAIELGARYAAPFNNDAVADKDWLKKLVRYLDEHPETGIATCKIQTQDGSKLDSTGDYYTNWGLPYPRGRGETDTGKYDALTEIFGASGGASLYRVAMLEQIGLLDEDFFAYYEDVDLSFRAQLAGWKVAYVPDSVVYHQIGGTSGKISGFTTYQTLKNLPMLMIKNVPGSYLYKVWWRLSLVYILFLLRALSRGQFWIAIKGGFMGCHRLFSSLGKRRRIQSNKAVSDEYIWQMMVHDLPPNARALRKMRGAWWKLTGKHA